MILINLFLLESDQFQFLNETLIIVCHSNEATEQYFHTVLFIMLYKVVLTFQCVDETLVCVHSIES